MHQLVCTHYVFVCVQALHNDGEHAHLPSPTSPPPPPSPTPLLSLPPPALLTTATRRITAQQQTARKAQKVPGILAACLLQKGQWPPWPLQAMDSLSILGVVSNITFCLPNWNRSPFGDVHCVEQKYMAFQHDLPLGVPEHSGITWLNWSVWEEGEI